MFKTKCAALFALAIATTTPLRAQILNGSFETSPSPSSGYVLYNVGETFLGTWTVIGAPGQVGIVGTNFVQDCCTFPAQNLNYWLDLTGNSNTATGVRQTVSTVIGQNYNLSFWVGNVVDRTGVFGLSSTVRVVWGGTDTFMAVNSTGGTTLSWMNFNRNFLATSTSTTVDFSMPIHPTTTATGLITS